MRAASRARHGSRLRIKIWFRLGAAGLFSVAEAALRDVAGRVCLSSWSWESAPRARRLTPRRSLGRRACSVPPSLARVEQKKQKRGTALARKPTFRHNGLVLTACFGGVKRTSVMHLKPYHKLSKKDPSLESSLNTRDQVNHRIAAKEEKYTPTNQSFHAPPVNASYHRPLESTCLCIADGKSPPNSLDGKGKVYASPLATHHGEEGEGTLDIRAVIKPGNTKEKIAFFASHQCSNNRTCTMKHMGFLYRTTWEINGRAAKRRKKSMELKAKTNVEKAKGPNKCHQFEPFACGINHCSVHLVEGSNAIFSDGSSVINMVAFLEQRASALISDATKKCTNSSSAARLAVQSKNVLSVSEHFKAIGPCEMPFSKGSFESGEQESEAICVLDMVAKLESECLKHQSERNSGSLSRNNSFRRHVGRMLLASASNSDGAEKEQSKTSDSKTENGSFMHQHHSGSSANRLSGDEESSVPCVMNLLPERKNFSSPALELEKGTSLKTVSSALEIHASAVEKILPLCSRAVVLAPKCSPSKRENNNFSSEEAVTCSETFAGDSVTVTNARVCVSVAQKVYAQEKTFNFTFSKDPLPGTLFFQYRDDQSHNVNSELCENAEENVQCTNRMKSASEDKDCKNKPIISLDTVSIAYVGSESTAINTSLKRQVSLDFWKIRYRIQQLLEPQQYMVFLPHHIMLSSTTLNLVGTKENP
ncbi:hypothetical protein NDU88_001951 [Pleurodeles waltl]|uniref:Uncharacterized protein n=1 Tax=Pleurodeles waltl TaxID=8319 RepID=A0AAV7ML93_PLEWA|nr:hypothetical protein NDU88_001951 [Pleurodeles waltl]